MEKARRKQKKYQKNYQIKNKEKLKIKRKIYRIENKDKRRQWELSRKYNITLEQYSAMYISQSGVCLICGENKKSATDKYATRFEILHVDHCHKTNKVRGLLCSKCNKVLGVFEDNVAYLINAIKYLRG